MAPVAPSGWPMAMAPPATLILSWGTSKACMKRSTTEENASLSSKRSMSAGVMPAFFSTLRVTSTGPVSISAVSEPMWA